MYHFESVDLTDAPPVVIGHLTMLDLMVEHMLLAGIRGIDFSSDFGRHMRYQFFLPLWHRRKQREGGFISNAPWLYENDYEFTTLSDKIILRAYKEKRKLGITDTATEIATRLLRD